jgi:DNA processing protein
LDQVQDLIRVGAVSGLGRARYGRLVERFGSWDQAARASVRDLTTVAGITAELAAAIRRTPELDVSAELEEARRLGIALVPYTDPAYPANLRLLDDAPLLLYMRGTIEERDRIAIAVVGARNCSYYGLSQAERLSYGLARAGFCIVSGLAWGIDAAAHRAALKAGGRTIAVQGCGLKGVYPEEHAELAEEIARHGAVLSEVPLDTPPRAQNFPPRNRIISGLSLGVVVVEARRNSGALITARWAMETGKEVYAVPGQINDPRSRGCHALLKDGAKLVESIEDIVEELGPLAQSIELPAREGEEAYLSRGNLAGLTESERKAYAAVGHAPVTVDEVSAAGQLGVSRTLASLLVLEMRGLVKQLPGKRFVRTSSSAEAGSHPKDRRSAQ